MLLILFSTLYIYDVIFVQLLCWYFSDTARGKISWSHLLIRPDKMNKVYSPLVLRNRTSEDLRQCICSNWYQTSLVQHCLIILFQRRHWKSKHWEIFWKTGHCIPRRWISLRSQSTENVCLIYLLNILE